MDVNDKTDSSSENEETGVDTSADIEKRGRHGKGRKYKGSRDKHHGTIESSRDWQKSFRSRVQAANLEKKLLKHINGEAELSPTALKAAEILLKKTVPDLSSIEGEVHHDWENLDPNGLAQQVAAVLAANPQLLIDALRDNEHARLSVFAAIDSYRSSLPSTNSTIQ